MVARDGIEPPTPAFSGWLYCIKLLIPEHPTIIFTLENAIILEW